MQSGIIKRHYSTETVASIFFDRGTCIQDCTHPRPNRQCYRHAQFDWILIIISIPLQSHAPQSYQVYEKPGTQTSRAWIEEDPSLPRSAIPCLVDRQVIGKQSNARIILEDVNWSDWLRWNPRCNGDTWWQVRKFTDPYQSLHACYRRGQAEWTASCAKTPFVIYCGESSECSIDFKTFTFSLAYQCEMNKNELCIRIPCGVVYKRWGTGN